MKTPNLTRTAACLLTIAILFSLCLTSDVQALTLNYSDSTWEYLTATGPSVTKAGNTEIYTISGKLSANTSGAVHIKLWLINASQVYKVILDDDALLAGNYLAGSSFAKSYNVNIPADSDNNKYIYATVDAGTRHFTNFTLTLVQNPTYVDLQSQLSQTQTQASNLTAQLSSQENSTGNLQEQISSLQEEKAALELLLDELEGFNADLQEQADGLQTNNTKLETENSNLRIQVGSLQNSSSLQTHQGNSTAMQIAINHLSNQTLTLQAQLTDVEAANSAKSLIVYVAFAGLAALAVATGILVIKIRKKKSPVPVVPPRRSSIPTKQSPLPSPILNES